MNVYRITSYHCDENGKPFGEPFQHIVYTDELMETYKNKKYVEKIDVFVRKAGWKSIWTKDGKVDELD